MSKFIKILFFFCTVMTVQSVSAANIFCGPRNVQTQDGTWVAVSGSEGCKSSDGNGVYNGRRKTGIVFGAIIGGGIASALGGDPSAIVSGVLGGAQTGTYIGSTFDADAQVRDTHLHNAQSCGDGTHYNTISQKCEAGGSASQQTAFAPQATNRQAEGEAICRQRGHSGYSAEKDQCFDGQSTQSSATEENVETFAAASAPADANAACASIAQDKVCVAPTRWQPVLRQNSSQWGCGCN